MRIKPKKEEMVLSNQINPTIFTLFEQTNNVTDGITLDQEEEASIRMDLHARIDTIRGIGNKTASRITHRLKIRNKLADLAGLYSSNPDKITEILSKYIFSNFDETLNDIRIAANQHKKNPYFSHNAPHRDILYEILWRAPQIGLALNKYWRNYIFNTPELRDRLPKRCITCGKIFQFQLRCAANRVSHWPPPDNFISKPRFSLTPLSDNHIVVKLTFSRTYESSWQEKLFNTNPPSWSELWYPLKPLEEIGNSELWVYTRLPDLTHKWTHYDFWMLQKFFDGLDFAVKLCYGQYEALSKSPGLCIKMKRVKVVNQMTRWDKLLYLNLP